MEQQIRFCTASDGVRIAYFSAGRGPAIVFASNIWGDANMYAAPHPHTRYMTDRLVELGWRVVRYDLRGMGSSQRDVDDFSLEAGALDLQAVVDHLSLQRFAVAGVDYAAAVAMAFAAGNGDRVSHVVVLNGWAFAPERARVRVSNALASMSSLAEEDWEFFTLAIAKLVTELDDPVHTQRLAETFRRSSSAKVHQAYGRVLDQIDLRPILPALEMPVLVVHDTGFPFGSFELCQDLAASLPDARFVVIAADRDAEIDAIDTFLRGGSGEPAEPQPAGAFRTVMFTDIEGSTVLTQRLGDATARELLREHERIVREALKAHGGSEVKTMGDGFMASFGSATRALGCAIAVQRAFAERNAKLSAHPEPVEGRAEPQPPAHGSTGSGRADGDVRTTPVGEPIRVRIGLNAGEPVAENDDLFGTAVIAAARIAALAEGGEILASDVVRQLVAGKGFLFADRGEAALRGFEEPVRLYQVRWEREREGQA